MDRFRKQTLTVPPEEGAERGGKGFEFRQSKIWSQKEEEKAKRGSQGKPLTKKDPKFLAPPTSQLKLEVALSFPTLTMPISDFPPLNIQLQRAGDWAQQ